MTHVIIGRWGTNLAIRLPGEIAEAAGVTEGESVEIEARGDEIVLRRLPPRFSVKELFRGRTPGEWRAEYAGAYNWGPDVGREIVEE
jgi:antitoxin MazE